MTPVSPRKPAHSRSRYELVQGDALEALRSLPAASFDGAFFDPPYGLGLRKWDTLPPAAFWLELKCVLRPGSWILIFGHPRTHHRLMTAMEEAGLEIRDVLLWLFGTGFPKGRTLKPAWQPIVLARRPGPARCLNIDACRIQSPVLPSDRRKSPRGRRTFWGTQGKVRVGERHDPRGRWPANLLLGHGQDCGVSCSSGCPVAMLGGETGQARFFYCPKPAGREIDGNWHPMRKPLALDAHLARLILSPSLRDEEKRLLVPYCGSGSEMVAGLETGWEYVCGIDNSVRWLRIAKRRLDTLEVTTCNANLEPY